MQFKCEKESCLNCGWSRKLILSSYFFREYCFKQQAWCQPTSNQVVLMPKLRQMACEKWLAGLEVKKISRKLLLFWEGSVVFQKLYSRREI